MLPAWALAFRCFETSRERSWISSHGLFLVQFSRGCCEMCWVGAPGSAETAGGNLPSQPNGFDNGHPRCKTSPFLTLGRKYGNIKKDSIGYGERKRGIKRGAGGGAGRDGFVRRAEPGRAPPDFPERHRAEPCRTPPSLPEPSRTLPSPAEPFRPPLSVAEPSPAEPFRSLPNFAEPSRASPHPPSTHHVTPPGRCPCL